MYPLNHKKEKIDSLVSQMFGLLKPHPYESEHWPLFEEKLDHVNEVAGVAVLSDKNRSATKVAFRNIGETKDSFLRKNKELIFYKDVKNHPGWTMEDFKTLYKIESGNFDDALFLVEKMISRMNPVSKKNRPVWQVCGQINNGYGDKNSRLRIFFETILKISNNGLLVFDQLPFVPVFDSWQRELGWDPKNTPIIEKFFKRLFEEKMIQNTAFLYGFEDSIGALEEHDIAYALGHINIFHLPKDFEKSKDGLFKMEPYQLRKPEKAGYLIK